MHVLKRIKKEMKISFCEGDQSNDVFSIKKMRENTPGGDRINCCRTTAEKR